MSGIVKYSQIATAATSSEVDANSQFAITVDMLGTPTTKYLTGEVLKEVIRDEFGDFFLVAGTGITVVHDDALNTFTISVTPNTYQPLDAGLTSISGLTTAADKMIYTTASDTYAVADLSSFARTILDDADALTARATLGLVIGTNVQAYSANLDALAADPLTATTAASTYQPLDADLTAIAALSSADGNFIVGSATGWVAESGATARTSLGLGTGDNVQFTNGTFTGTLAVTGVATFSNRIRFGAGTYPGAGIPSAYTTAVEGLTITSSAGSSYDFLLANGSGQSVILIPTGTTGIQVFGSATIASDITLASGSITSASGAISFGDENLSTTGTLASGNATVTGTLAVSYGSGAFPASFTRTGDPMALYAYSDAGGVAILGNSSASLTGAQYIYLTPSGIIAEVPSGDTHNMSVNGSTVLSVASTGATVTGTLGVTGKITGAASTTSAATINLPAGTAPTSPAESDMWFVGDVMYRRIGGVTKSVTFT